MEYICDKCKRIIKEFKNIDQRWRVGCPYCNRAFDDLDIKLLKRRKEKC